MLNEKQETEYKKELGYKLFRASVIQGIIKSYEDELNKVNKELDELFKKIVEEVKNGSTI